MESEQIIKSFKQGGAGNCVSIAAIKATMELLGYDAVLLSVSKINHGTAYEVVLRNQRKFILTNDEYHFAIHRSFIRQLEFDDNSTKLFKCARFYFAVMAKVAQTLGNDKQTPVYMSYNEAIGTLNNGEDGDEGLIWLGLEHAKQTINVKELKKTDGGLLSFLTANRGIIGSSSKHCFLISKGWRDDYGRANLVDSKSEQDYIRYARTIDLNKCSEEGLAPLDIAII